MLGYTPQEFYDDPRFVIKVTHDDDVDAVARARHEGVDDVQSMQLRMDAARRHADLDRAPGGAAAERLGRGDRGRRASRATSPR